MTAYFNYTNSAKTLSLVKKCHTAHYIKLVDKRNSIITVFYKPFIKI
jgi:hypothetical protein